MYIMLSYLFSILRSGLQKRLVSGLLKVLSLQFVFTTALISANNIPSNRFEDPCISITNWMLTHKPNAIATN